MVHPCDGIGLCVKTTVHKTALRSLKSTELGKPDAEGDMCTISVTSSSEQGRT